MNVKALGIFIGKTQRVGVLFQYALGDTQVVNRFVADDAFANLVNPPVLSLSMQADDPTAQKALWAEVGATLFNGTYSAANGWLLPAFFQNLLPEGVFRDHVADQRGCDPKDHFEMLAACGLDLPGNVYALPLELTRDELAHYVTQDADALEMSVTADPLEGGVSLSGIQPKVGVIKQGGRYVGRTKMQDTHIIAKLPVVGQPLLPELEHLSLRLAAAAGVSVTEAHLEPLEKLAVEHGYDLGEAGAKTNFLAVTRYDRTPQGRVHCEDFAQVLGVPPEQKYLGASYLDIAGVMLAFSSLGESAVHELLRRIVVNEMLGNPDMHLKNIGVWYPDGRTPELPPAYDIVAYAAYNRRIGHALHILPTGQVKPRMSVEDAQRGKAAKAGISPQVIRQFCSELEIPEKPAAAVVRKTVADAVHTWPQLIQTSPLTGAQKERLLTHFTSHPLVESLLRRQQRSA
ncbi:type II toxin-antitoxin system HipA family toxin [Burkholderia multivorans]|jgi:serine/threonine-protein kinase HipA|uniref:type II toxin-antitoxin system HipA family toxin n=1 Tax=Burkholderia multivorans TaxID=87883 RepID=UPI001C235150|nr:type II toxin-antitoxin system HipA family toxin [Burkholderia multivorans]MBU9200348.1 type II toxin-antitoxin system HipA family toxin [Burkholderia multivorans]MDN8078526.1 type II toxin-antitoxin system HipA family toxin [Burkholderia multivorans]